MRYPLTPKASNRNQTQSGSDNNCEDMTIRNFSKWRPTAILDLVQPSIAPFYRLTPKNSTQGQIWSGLDDLLHRLDKLLEMFRDAANSVIGQSLTIYINWCHIHQWPLHSAGTNRLAVPPVKLTTNRAFPVVGPRTWNDLPDDVTSAESSSTFRQRLKSHLFTKSFFWSFPGLDFA